MSCFVLTLRGDLFLGKEAFNGEKPFNNFGRRVAFLQPV
jgi:hypothetical protein